ncbi:MAG TPA: glycosyltransferase [Polyangiaceae bacterium]|nr:glycosyltransferase [Polyangiaceae bacterium]
MSWLLLIPYAVVLVVLCGYGAHRAHLAWQCSRYARKLARLESTPALPAELPTVTIQLPLYNEATVARRLILSTGAMDYPKDKFEIQVLDDSTDETAAIARAAVEELKHAGIDASYVRRPSRHGYKAGALDYGLKFSRGELVAMFDADFIPQPSFLKSVVGHFTNPRIGMVQTRWDHANREHSMLTRVQALMLDGHHLVENRARYASGCFFNFSGTGGIWRVDAIHEAGGWQHDTLTEDLDLSYRAQLVGWRFVYRADVLTPSELPEDMSSFRAQQFRWAKGTVQTARKLLATVLAAEVSLAKRAEAAFHMLPHFAYPATVLLTLMLLPALLFMPATSYRALVMVDLPLCLGATGSLAAFYGMAEVARGRSRWHAIAKLPALIALGAGLAPHLTGAVIDGLRSMSGEFVRTPKRGEAKGRYRQAAKLPWAELGLAGLSSLSVLAAIETGHWLAMPFAALFALGYGTVAVMVVREQSQRPALAEPESVRPPADVPSVANAA